MKAIVMMLAILAAAFATQTPLSNLSMFLSDVAADIDRPIFIRHAPEKNVGSSCTGSEGAWNCMSSSFQRCASGKWSRAIECANGTVCLPEGFAYDFQTFAISAAPSTMAPSPTSSDPAVSTFVVTETGHTSTSTTSTSSTTACPDKSGSTCSTSPATKSTTEETSSPTVSGTATQSAPKNDTSDASRRLERLSCSVFGIALGIVFISQAII